MRINKFFPFAFIYFFLNSLGLPFGLTWMALMAPFFYFWVLKERRTDVLLPFLVVLSPFIFMHILVVGVDLKVYLVSLLNIFMVYVFCQAFYTFLLRCADPENIFRKILVINFVFCLLGIVFYFTPYYEWFWIEQEFTKGVKDFKRFKLFTYEASYYATLFIPIFFYFLLQYVLMQNRIPNYLLLPMLFLPLILSFSIGVISAAAISIVMVIIFHYRQLLVKRRIVNMSVNLGLLSAATLFVLVFYFRNNPIFTRILNIFSGRDTSAMGRTSEAFYLAQQMLDQKNDWWGIGVGQVKILGHNIIQDYYLYNMDFVATIPNGTAETWAIFGWWGLILKFSLEIGLFIYTKVWTNYYRLLLFIFIFIYQFTGSFVTNLAEYGIWILAFTNVFSRFDAKTTQRATSLINSA